MDYSNEWTIIEDRFWCRHKLGDKCVYFAKPEHKCIKDKCPIELKKYIEKRQGIKRGPR